MNLVSSQSVLSDVSQLASLTELLDEGLSLRPQTTQSSGAIEQQLTQALSQSYAVLLQQQPLDNLAQFSTQQWVQLASSVTVDILQGSAEDDVPLLPSPSLFLGGRAQPCHFSYVALATHSQKQQGLYRPKFSTHRQATKP